MKILNVAEKPSVAKQLVFALNQYDQPRRLQSFSKYNPVSQLNGQFQNQDAQIIITSVTGHIKEFAYINSYGWRQLDPQKLLIEEQVQQKLSDDKQNIAKNLEKYAKDSNVLFLWLDCDREGEAIAYEVIDICKNVNRYLKIYRAKFSSTSPREMLHAFNNPIYPDERQNEGVLARQELDLRSGAAFTRFLTLTIGDNFNLNKNKLSYGTCQIPTLSFIVKRYLEIKHFCPQPFYYINLVVEKDKIKADFNWKRQRLYEKIICAAIYQKITKNPIVKIIKVKKTNKSKFKPFPLTTLDFSKMASIYLNLSSKKAMDIAEKLYQNGFISYPRTETNIYPNQTNFKSLLQNLQDNDQYKEYIQGMQFQTPRKGKKDDKAHPPIHPIKNYTGDQSSLEFKVYDLIARRFIANCSEDAKIAEVEVTAEVDEEYFDIKGVQILEQNYLQIYQRFEKFKEKNIPNFEEGQQYKPHELTLKDGKTQPPKLLSESDLISTMDQNKIGTDATIHEHIEKIIQRQYVKKIKKLFHPTQLGVALILSLRHLNLKIDNPQLRAETEVQVQKICDGITNRQTMVQKFIKIMDEDYSILKQNQEKLIRIFIQSFNEHQDLDKLQMPVPEELKIPDFNFTKDYYQKNKTNGYQPNQETGIYSTNTSINRKQDRIKIGKCKCRKGTIQSQFSQKNTVMFRCTNYQTCKRLYFCDGFYPIDINFADEEECIHCSKKVIILTDAKNEKKEKCLSTQKQCVNSIMSFIKESQFKRKSNNQLIFSKTVLLKFCVQEIYSQLRIQSFYYLLQMILKYTLFIHFITATLQTKQEHVPVCYIQCKENQQLDFLQKMQCFSKCQKKDALLQQKIKLEKVYQQFSNLPNNYCLKEREAKTYKQKLKYFAEGPCSPIILAPGTISTKLVVQIDCKILKQKNFDIFQTCGWTDCSKQPYEVWKKVPSKEYKLWINDVVSPISFFGSQQANLCFSKLFQTNYDFSRQQDHWILKTEGYRVIISGFTPQTMSKNKCGADAIRNLLPIPIQIKSTHAFSNIINELERLGYTTGLTYQAMPYNFYNSLYQSEFTINFKKQVLRIFRLTGKQITIIAHSNGNLLTLYNLQKYFTKEEKEKYFKNYISLAAPYLGAYQANRYLLAGNNDFIDSTNYLGFKWSAAKIFYDYQSSLYFFQMRNFIDLYQKESWYKKIEQRINYEKNQDVPYEDSGILFWPKKDDVCYRDNLKAFSNQCLLDFEDPNEDFIFIGQDEKYSINNFSQAIKKHNKNAVVDQLYKNIFPVNIGAINPGIPTFLVYVGLLETDHKIYFKDNFDQNIANDKYPEIEKIFITRGDGSVPHSSFLLPGFRWALKSDEGDDNYKKVTFVEMCSQINQDTQIYDGYTTDGSKSFSENKYVGRECECSNSNLSQYHDCKHSNIVNDKFFVELVTEILDVSQIASEQQLSFIDEIDEEYLMEQSEYCTHYVTDIFEPDQNQESNNEFQYEQEQ